MKLLFPREPGQRLVREKRKRKKLATNALQVPGDSPGISSQVKVKPKRGWPTHCQLLIAMRVGQELMNTLLSLILGQGKEKKLSLICSCARDWQGHEQEYLLCHSDNILPEQAAMSIHSAAGSWSAAVDMNWTLLSSQGSKPFPQEVQLLSPVRQWELVLPISLC